jgi:methyltransferase
VTLAVLVLALDTLERLGELALSRSNATRLHAARAAEHGRGHYPVIVGLHVAWLAGLWLLA